MNLSDLDRGWLAGILEGEGTFSATVRHRRSDNQTTVTCRIRIASTDRDVIERVARITGYGRVYELGRPTVTGKRVFSWDIGKRDQVQAVVDAVFPLLSERRQQQILAMFQKRDAVPQYKRPQQTHCKRGHELTPENTYVRKNGVRRCKTCQLAGQRERYRRQLEASMAAASK